MTENITLETEKLILRPLRAQDACALANLVNDYEVSKWLTRVSYPYDLAEMEYFIQNANSPYRVGLECKNTGQIMGVCGIEAQLGYWLGQKYWGQGYMPEAVKAVVAHWFAHGGGDIASSHMLENHKSRAILTNNGFEDTELKTTLSKARGSDVTVQHMRLTQELWDLSQQGAQSN